MNRYSDAPILDIARLDMLEKNIGTGLNRICDRFLCDCAGILENLSATIRAGNREETRRLAHQMKGSSVSLGLPRLEACFRFREEAVRDGADIPGDWHEVATGYLEEVRQALEKRKNEANPLS